MKVRATHICTEKPEKTPSASILFEGPDGNDQVNLSDDGQTALWFHAGRHFLSVTQPHISAAVIVRQSLVIVHRDVPNVHGRCGPSELAYVLSTYSPSGERCTVPLVHHTPRQALVLGDGVLLLGKCQSSHHTFTSLHYAAPKRTAMIALDALWVASPIRVSFVLRVGGEGPSTLNTRVLDARMPFLVATDDLGVSLIKVNPELEWFTISWERLSHASKHFPDSALLVPLPSMHDHDGSVRVCTHVAATSILTLFKAIPTLGSTWIQLRVFDGPYSPGVLLNYRIPILLAKKATSPVDGSAIEFIDAMTGGELGVLSLPTRGDTSPFTASSRGTSGTFVHVGSETFQVHVGILSPLVAQCLEVLARVVSPETYRLLEYTIAFHNTDAVSAMQLLRRALGCPAVETVYDVILRRHRTAPLVQDDGSLFLSLSRGEIKASLHALWHLREAMSVLCQHEKDVAELTKLLEKGEGEENNVLTWAERLMECEGVAMTKWPTLTAHMPNKPKIFVPLNDLVDILWTTFARTDAQRVTHHDQWFHRMTTALHSFRWTLEHIETLSPGFRILFQEGLALCKENPLPRWEDALYALVDRPDVGLLGGTSVGQGSVPFHSQPRTALPRRIERWLDSSQPCTLRNYDATMDVQSILLEQSKRVLSVNVGRGMLHLMTRAQKDNTVTITPMNFTGMAGKVLLRLEAAEVSPEKIVWSEFHNGCAAGLEFVPSDTATFSREWIGFQVNSVPNIVARAGVLFAFGLLGQLKHIHTMDLYTYLSQRQRHDPTIIATLLGTCCSSRGTGDPLMTSCLGIHIQSLVSPRLDLDLNLDVQSAALLSLGLLYQDSCDRFYVELFIGDLMKAPNDEYSHGRDGYSLAAGFGLGLVLLGRGDKSRLVVDRLMAALNGSSWDDVRQAEDQTRHALNLLDLEGSSLSSRIRRPNSKGAQGQCTRILETDRVNSKVTGAGAAVALALAYIKSNDLNIAQALAPPTTPELLEYLHPEAALLRMTCHCLVLWNDVRGTQQWLRSKLSPVVRRVMEPIPKGEQQEFELAMLDFRPGGTRHLMNLCAYLNAGAVFGMGLRFVGTMRRDIRDVILAELHGYVHGFVGTFKVNARSKSLVPMEACISSCAIAAALVMCGTADETTALAVRAAQRTATTYGLHMALGMALGLVHLGGGTLTFEKKPSTLALLLLSFYPVWPKSAVDNVHHLQACRHLYAAAAVRRTLTTRDSVSTALVDVPVKVVLTCGVDHEVVPAPLELRTPCLLPETSEIERVEILGESKEYYNLTLFREDLLKSRSICLVRRQSPSVLSAETPAPWASAYAIGVNSPDACLTHCFQRAALTHDSLRGAAAMTLGRMYSHSSVDEIQLLRTLYTQFVDDSSAGLFSRANILSGLIIPFNTSRQRRLLSGEERITIPGIAHNEGETIDKKEFAKAVVSSVRNKTLTANVAACLLMATVSIKQ